MASEGNSLQLIGMIPRPDEEYRAALAQSMDSLKSAITDQGIDPSRIAPMPTRMLPVAQDAKGVRYVLVSMCNQNGRPTAVPLSSIYPDDPSKQGELPETFVPVDTWESNHPASAGLPPDVPGVTAPIENAMPQPPLAVSASAPAGGNEVNPYQANLNVPMTFQTAGDFLNEPRFGGSLNSPDTGTEQAQQPQPLTDEEKTRQLMKGALPGMKARGSFGEMGGALLGIMAQQDPSAGRVNFQKLMAEKASALQPGSSVYTRLKEALQTFDQINDQL